MIIDLKKFISNEKGYWEELDQILSSSEKDPYKNMTFDQIKRIHYLYQRASADLVKINTFSAEGEIRQYLESMVGRAFTLIYGTRRKAVRFSFLNWFFRSFPATVRKHYRMLILSLAMMTAGGLFGGAAIIIDPEAKMVLLPFEHLQMDPADRVAREEAADALGRAAGGKAGFSAFLMTHNTRVSILALALGMTWGIGTTLLLFSNGVLLGAVIVDYIRAGQTIFLTGWLLPHGAVEIPSVLIAGQAGLVLAGALIGGASGKPLAQRFREIMPDLVTLIGGVAVLLVWAGIIESFFSQHHEPVLSYEVKIAFGVAELGLLAAYFLLAGKNRSAGP